MLEQVLNDGSVENEYKTRLVLLYALRYEKMQGNRLPVFIDLLKKSGCNEQMCSVSYG